MGSQHWHQLYFPFHCHTRGPICTLSHATACTHALEEAESKTCIILDHNLATHTYFSHDLKPAVFKLTDPYISPDYFDPTWMSSTYAVREIDYYYRTLSGEDYYYKEAAIDARSPQNEADNFERDFIEALNADPSLVDQALVRTLNGK
jgi:hypothetical protein